jgi:hypothetical protein
MIAEIRMETIDGEMTAKKNKEIRAREKMHTGTH